jgi:hypothetical protein
MTGDVITYIQQHSRTRYFLSPQLAQAIAMQNGSQLQNVRDNPADAERYLFSSKELSAEQFTRLLCNRPGQYRLVSGPLEVNIDYYPDWLGNAHTIDVSMQRAWDARMVPRP